MRGFFSQTAVALLSVWGLSLPAQAQSEADFIAAFAGEWQSLDPAFSSGGACRIVLEKRRVGPELALTVQNCAEPFAKLGSWRIDKNQIALVGVGSVVIARLGGNQNRMSGEMDGGKTVTLDRIAHSQASAGAAPGECVYYGYTATCASTEQKTIPVSAGQGSAMRVNVLVALNARAEARSDAAVRATIPAETCVVVDQCTTARDGNWCQVSVANYAGWIRQVAVRLDRWPVLTFVSDCR